MDNLNDNQSSLKKELDAENKEWLAALLGGADIPSEEKEDPVPEAETAPVLEATADSADAELERILNEDWSNTSDIPTPNVIPQNISDDPELADILADAELAEITPISAEIEESEPEASENVPVSDIPEPANEPDPQKIRPKRRSGYGLLGIPHILSTVVWLALIVAIGVSLGRVLWVCCADVMAFGKEAKAVTITITEDDTIDTIAKKLGYADLVRYPGLFKFFATITGKDDDIGVGTFTLNAQFDYNAMINAMYDSGPDREVVKLMFPEGYNCAQIFKLLEEHNVCTVAELEDYAANGELEAYWFLEGVPRGAKYCLEGYLAPDTYQFYTDDEPRRVLEKFLDEFEDRFTDLMKEDFKAIQKTYADRLKAKGFSADYITEHTLTIHQIVSLASVIQKETSSDGECYDIASAFYNRLVAPDILTLGADATVYYALGDYFWEIEELTAEHLNVDSPYNTRKYKGIPPGPICNMGVHALYAALEPNDTKYHYFVYDPAKHAHRFAATYSEHLKNLAELGY